jgi:hypothetical protein
MSSLRLHLVSAAIFDHSLFANEKLPTSLLLCASRVLDIGLFRVITDQISPTEFAIGSDRDTFCQLDAMKSINQSKDVVLPLTAISGLPNRPKSDREKWSWGRMLCCPRGA